MPPEARWFVRTGLLCLVLTGVSGTLRYLLPEIGFLRPMHTHLGTVGWLMNMVFGVALWMFPMPAGSFETGRPRYSRPLVIATYLGINGGLVLRFLSDAIALAPAQVTSGVLQTAGILLGVAALWPRIRGLKPA